ncbi:iron-containing alcohol dehydrogenase [Abyssibacter sp.]|uniref:iron-containing alcohol dehydrogenase n=1 Tax=Abyssibacter sp. TaxID=2320200 RepID=UPI0035139885
MLFSLQVLFYRFYMFLLKTSIRVLPFREPRLFTGADSALALCDALSTDGTRRLMIVTDAVLVKIGLVEPLRQRLEAAGITVTVFDGVEPDPSVALIEQGLQQLKRDQADAILAIGGGSSIDAAKVIAARATNNKAIRKMEGLFRVFRRPLPLHVIPTTAGTGSEVTIAAVVSDPERQKKMSIIDLKLAPVTACLDGKLMAGLPPGVTAATGMDALTHAVEAYISRNAMKRTDVYAVEATRLIMEHLPQVMDNGNNIESRQQMALASYKAGIAFTQAGVGYVHAISHNFGARYHTPHGLGNAIVLPHVLEFSKTACADRLADLARVSGLDSAGASDMELAERFIHRIREMNAQFGIPTGLEALEDKDIPAIAKAAMAEAHLTYAVPRYMDRPTCEAFIRTIKLPPQPSEDAARAA